MNSFLDNFILRFYPRSSEKIKEIVESNMLLDKLVTAVYNKVDNYIQKRVDVSERIITLAQILHDWRVGAYKTISYKNISISIFVLMYFVNPYDFVPDFIPFIGKKDDDFVLKKGLIYLDEEIKKYKNWKEQQ
jgi:uncharacterized membrane protein YkvA (DUF1232 family)